MVNMITVNELVLDKEPYEIEVPVKIFERVQISGYIRTKEDENKDAAVIVFDFGDVEIDEKILKAHGFVKSKIGIFKYLPVSKEFQIWTVSMFIPEKMEKLTVRLFTWKNKYDVIVGKDIDIKKDYAYSLLHRALHDCQKSLNTKGDLQKEQE